MAELELRAVIPGWEATIVRDDGTAVSFWGATRADARTRALEHDAEVTING